MSGTEKTMNDEQIKRLMQLYGLQLVKMHENDDYLLNDDYLFLCGHGLFWHTRFSCWETDFLVEENIPTAFDGSAEPVQSWVKAGCPEPKIGN